MHKQRHHETLRSCPKGPHWDRQRRDNLDSKPNRGARNRAARPTGNLNRQRSPKSLTVGILSVLALALVVWPVGGFGAPAPSEEKAARRSAQAPEGHVLRIRTFIDGSDTIKIRGDEVWYEHHTWDLPGKWRDLLSNTEHDEPTFINGTAWKPEWQENISKPFGLRQAVLPRQTNERIQVSKIAGRGPVSVTESPKPENDYTLAILLDDGGYAGAEWYEIAIYQGASAAPTESAKAPAASDSGPPGAAPPTRRQQAVPSAAQAKPLALIPAPNDLPGTLIFQGRYKHRSRGQDLPQPSELFVKQTPDGGILALASLPFMGSTELATGDKANRLTAYRIARAPSGSQPGYGLELELGEGKARLTPGGVASAATQAANLPADAVVQTKPAPAKPDRPAAPAYATDLAAFFKEADQTYPFFDLKGIRSDWEQAKARLSDKVKSCASGGEFLGLVREAIGCLRDAHLGLLEAQAPLPQRPKRYYPGLSFMPATKGRVIIMSASANYADKLKPGTVVTKIDGQDARTVLEDRAKAAWGAENPYSVSSPQRARLFAYRLPLTGPRDEPHTLHYSAEGQERELAVSCRVEVSGWPHTYNPPANLARVGRGLSYGKLASGAGYLYLRNVGQETEAGLTQALKAHPEAKGWIIDLRGNGGGGYDQKLIERLKTIPRPVVGLIDAGCISAGETLARDLAQHAQARLLGSRTAGASSSKRTWAFPSGIAKVRFSVRSRWRSDGQPIEYNGIAPDVEVEAVPEEVAQGLNSEILRAEESLRRP